MTAEDIPEDIMRSAKECSDQLPVDWNPDNDAEGVCLIALAILAERERCAKLAEAMKDEPCSGPEWAAACADIADAIRKG